MSVTIEDKIELFSKLIFGNIEAKSSQKKQKLAETQEKELEVFGLQIEKRKKEIMDHTLARADREKIKLTAQARNKQQHMLVNQKQQAMQKVMEKLREFAGAFTNSEEYKVYLENNFLSAIKALNKSNQITFYAMEKDSQLCTQILQKELTQTDKKIKYELKKVPHNIIGGIIAEDTENLLQLDLTLKALIDEHKDEIGAAITRRFNEVSSL